MERAKELRVPLMLHEEDFIPVSYTHLVIFLLFKYKKQANSKLFNIAMAFIAGGAIGNLIAVSYTHLQLLYESFE